MSVLQYPIATEKALNLVEMQNTIVYVVNLTANKTEIRKEFEDTFKVKVQRVNTAIEPYNMKRAYIKLAAGFTASDIAKKLKLV
ncbi:MAG TPA: 50S ribosomal protein L23 [Candidatus Saccharimonadales bacterium]|nr:50S ribosomal protein L23 [Candidatus Saccharimonadales bacterium]